MIPGLVLWVFIVTQTYANFVFMKDNIVQFLFTPPPNIEVYQLAHYQCSVDHKGIGITWNVNGTGSTNNDTIQLGIITYGAGSPSSSLTIPGYTQYNNTVVRCIALGFVDGNSYFNFSESTLRIQGKLAAVNNLICHVQKQYIYCFWSPPFSLVSIPGYIINITYGGELVTQNTTSSITWQYNYCPNQFGIYTISVAGNNSAGEGEISDTTKDIRTVVLDAHDYNITPKNISGNWTVTIIIKDNENLLNQSSLLLVYLKDNTSNTIVRSVPQGSTFTGNVNIGILPDNKKWNVTFRLEYDSGLLINTSTLEQFSTFDVQNGSLMITNSTTGEVCFTCYFLEGSQSQGCYIEYNSLITDYYSGNITIVRTSVDVSTASKFVTGIYTSNYNVTFYDMDYNNVSYTTEYAVKLTNQYVTGLSPTPTPTPILIQSDVVSSSSPSTTITTVSASNQPFSSTNIPSSSSIILDNTGNSGSPPSTTIIIVTLILAIVLLVIIIVIVLFVHIVLYRAKRGNRISGQNI